MHTSASENNLTPQKPKKSLGGALLVLLVILGISFYSGIRGHEYSYVGMLYAEGKYFFPKDYHKAIEWFKKAVDDDDVYGYYFLGLCYDLGNGVKPNKKGTHSKSASLSFIYTPMQEVTPKVVAMAVSTVIKMFRIFPQMFLFSMIE